MNHDDFAVNKLIVLYLLSRVKMPLSLSQMTQVILEKGYTDYFSLQQYLTELENSKFITISRQSNSSYYEIGDKGEETLEFFESRIPEFIVNELNQFIDSNWRRFKSELDIHAEYTPNKTNEYIVTCKVTENDSTLIDLNLTVGSKKQAVEMCNTWRSGATELYGEILQLFSK